MAVAVILLDLAEDDGRVTARTDDLANELGVSRTTAQRAVRDLITAGFMTRLVRGSYRIEALAGTVSSDRSLVNTTEERSYLDRTTSSTSSKTSKPDGSATHSQAPSAPNARINPICRKGLDMARYTDDGEDLAGFGLTEYRPPKPANRPKAKAVPNLHRAVPRDEWTMEFVVKEFRHRFYLWKNSGQVRSQPIGERLKPLMIGLRKWQAEYGVSVQEAADLCDRFWDDPDQTSRIGNAVPATNLFLHFVKMNIDSVRANELPEDYFDLLDAQAPL